MANYIDQVGKSRRYGFKLRSKLLVFATALPFLLFSHQGVGNEADRDETANAAVESESSEDRKDRVQRSILDAARQAERKHDNVNALSYYRSLYERSPNNIDVVVGMSRSLRRLGRSTEAEALVERALKTIARNHVLLAEAGKVQLSLGKAMPAIDSLSRAEALGAKAWDIYTALAVAYDRVGMFDQAEARYRKALELSPDNAIVLNNFALSRAQAGDLDQAIENLRRASALPEATPRMRQNLALFFAIKGDLKAAEDLVLRDLPPKDAAANMAYYRQLRAQVEADGDQTKLLGMTPKIVSASISGTASDADDKTAAVEEAATASQPVPAKKLTRVPMAKVEAIKVEDAKPLQTTRSSKKAAEDKASAQPKPATDQVVSKAKEAAKQVDDKPAAKQKLPPSNELKPVQSASLADDGVAYRLQLGAFRDAGRADTLVSKLMKSHETQLGALKLVVEKTAVANKGDFYRVVSQEFHNKELGRQSCEAFKKDGFTCLLARRN